MKKRKYSDTPIFTARDGKIYLLLIIIFLLASKYVEITHTPLITPIPQYPAKEVYASAPVEKPTSQSQEIEAYVKEVFGVHSKKALLLLKGNGGCAENRSLNPKAVNKNIVNGKVDSTDRGLFQINDKWQGFNNHSAKFLFNYKVNTQIAYQLFVENGNSFKLWTCGRALGI